VALSEPLSVWPLQPGTTYHYRIVAYNEAGTTYGDDQEVTTTNGTLPTVVTGAASDETTTSVTLHGTVDPEGEPLTACRFHYVTQDQFNRFGFEYSFGPTPTPMGSSVPCEETPAEIGEGDEPVPVHADLSGYAIGLYQFRLEAENAYDQATPGAASPFGTPPPQVEYLSPSPLRNESATLRFMVDPNGLETEYEVEYGPEAGNYNEYHYLWDGTVPAGDDPVLREAEIPAYWEPELWPGTEYHWRVVAKNAAGTYEGPDETFTTPDEPPPLLTTSPASGGTTAVAHLFGTVDPEGHEVTGCRFRWLPVGHYDFRFFEWHDATGVIRLGYSVPCVESAEEIGSGTEPIPVHADVSGMEPGEHYIRLEAENAYEDGVAPGIPIEIAATGEVGKDCEQDPGCGPPETKPPLVTPPPGQTAPNPKKKKPRKKKRHHRAHHNAQISARR